MTIAVANTSGELSVPKSIVGCTVVIFPRDKNVSKHYQKKSRIRENLRYRKKIRELQKLRKSRYPIAINVSVGNITLHGITGNKKFDW